MKPAFSFTLPGAVALVAGLPEAGAQESPRVEPIVVIGVRESLASAQARKRDATAIVDSVLAAEIHKLPDLGIGDAAQRITGVQIARDRGESSALAVRGLRQVETTLNGREVFTAGSGRTLDFADLAAESVAGIDIYKSAAADRLEGGIGGTIDLRTRQPFDFAGDVNVLALRWIHGDLVDRSAGQVSGLLSRRQPLAGGSEIGVLLSLALQDRAWREDQKSAGNPIVRNDLVAGVDVVAPNGTSETISLGRRRRNNASLLLRWRSPGGLELHAEAHHAELRTTQDSQQINVTAGTGFVADSVALFPGTTDLRSITWTDASVSVLSFARDTVDRTRQLAAGGRWQHDGLTLAADLSATKSFNHLFFSGPVFGGRAAQFSQNLSGDVPSTQVAGTDLLDPANLRYASLAYRTRPFAGDLKALRLDAEWRPADGVVERVATGWRQARRRADNAPGLVFADVALAGPTAADTPGRVMPLPYADFLAGHAQSIGGFVVGNLDGARDAAALRDAFGVTTPIPAAGNPLGVWQIHERTDALYAVIGAALPDLPLDGEAGLRLVHTSLDVTGSQTVVSSNTVAPLALASRYHDLLPSLSLRYRLDPALQLRAAASRTITRADFDQLSPSLTLLPNPVNPALNQGGAGNPALRPVRAHNLDLTIESLPAAGPAASLTLFWKQVDGFIASFSQPEEHDGAVYLISRPYNSDPARVRGAEFAWQRFFDMLPGAWRGLGLQLNYSYVDSRTPDRRLNADVPLQNLSRHSGNLIGLYERGAWSARLAYNRRSRFLSSVTSFVGVGALPGYTQGYGWLDASLSYAAGSAWTVTLEGSNLGGTLRRSNYGSPTRPQSAWVNDRQLALRASAAF
jgi:TonB-dependent receptor